MKRPLFPINLGAAFGWRPGKLAKDTFVMSGGMGMRTLMQAAVFLIVARILCVDDYGAYAAVLALAGVLGSFGGIGTQILMVRDVSRNPDIFAVAWGRTLAAIIIGSPVLFVVYLALAWAVLPAGLSLIVTVFIGLAEVVFAPFGLAGIAAYQGHERMGRASRLVMASVLPRLAGAVLLVPLALVLPEDLRLLAWAALYAAAALVAATYAWRLVYRDLGPGSKPRWRAIRDGFQEGLAFSFGGAALRVCADIDKTMLARLATLEAAGAYSAGYRITDIALVPIHSLLSSAMPRFFRAGESNMREVLAYAYRILPVPLAYALFAGASLYLSAGFLPLLLGPSYVGAVSSLKWLAWLPLVSFPRLFLQALLIGGDRQNATVVILGGGAAVNIVINLWLIPLWGWCGAVVATYLAEVIMACIMLVVSVRDLKDN